jgi:hypothetical protein
MRKTPARSKSVAASEGGSVATKDKSTRFTSATAATSLTSVESLSGEDGGSGVYVVERDDEPVRPSKRPSSAPRAAAAVHAVHEKAKKAMNPLLEQVTLVVYGWKSVEPGTLSWVFPSVTAAVAAARTMKNAVRWAIVAGRGRAESELEDEEGSAKRDDALDEARANGSVLIEQAG